MIRSPGTAITLAMLASALAACGLEASPSPTRAPSFAAVPTPRPTVTRAPTVSPTSTPTPVPTSAGTVYVIKRGDTLWAIAREFGITVDALREANPQITDPTRLRVGAELTIPAP